MLVWAATCQVKQLSTNQQGTTCRRRLTVVIAAAYIKAFLGLDVRWVFHTNVVNQAMQRKLAAFEFLDTVCNVPACSKHKGPFKQIDDTIVSQLMPHHISAMHVGNQLALESIFVV